MRFTSILTAGRPALKSFWIAMRPRPINSPIIAIAAVYQLIQPLTCPIAGAVASAPGIPTQNELIQPRKSISSFQMSRTKSVKPSLTGSSDIRWGEGGRAVIRR